MTPSVQRILWRLDVYDRVCRLCAQSNIAPLRFLTFRPEKLRIRIGESLQRSQVPVVFAADLADSLAAIIPAAQAPLSSGALGLDRNDLRRVLSLAQLDGDLDPLDVAGWNADPFLAAFTSLYVRFFEEARAAGSGEETAALFQLVAMSSLRNVALHRLGANDRFFGVAALLAHLADRVLADTVDKHGHGLSARLGLLMAASCSPLSLMGAAPAVVARPANAYRTLPIAFARARDTVRAHMDHPSGLDLTSLRARLSAELLTDPKSKRDLVRAMIAEAVRDLALLSTLTQGSELRDLASSSTSLSEALFQPLGTDKLRERIARHPRGREEPLARLQILIASVEAVVAGDLEPLQQVGSLEERADLAAVGAMVLALDELALEQAGHALGAVRAVPENEAEAARQSGRAYFFTLADEPLFLLPKKREEAFLFADMKDFTKRTVALQEESMGELLKTRFYEPILRTCGHFSRNPSARVSVVNLLGDAVACRGDIRSMVALALYVRRLLEDAAQDLSRAQDSVSSVDEAVQEIEIELSRIGHLLHEGLLGVNQRHALEQQQAELRAGREQKLASKVGTGLEAGVFVTWGREATVINVGGPEVGEWRVIIAEQLNAAARGTARSASMQKKRTDARLAQERAAGRAFIDPFSVHTSADPDDVTPSTDFHNAGSSLTGDALAAYQSESNDLVFRRMSIPRTSLPPRLHKYWLTRPSEEFVLCTDANGVAALLFRLSGRTIFRGLEANGAVDIWEILLVDRGLGRDFVVALGEV